MSSLYMTLPPGRGTKPIDLTGQRVGMLVVQGHTGVHVDAGGVRHLLWHCLCDCGGETTTSTKAGMPEPEFLAWVSRVYRKRAQ